MHFDDITDIDMEKMLENPKVTRKKRYSEDMLKKKLPGYKKEHYDSETLLKKLDVAISNEKKLCENIEELEHNVGSNLGTLFEEIRAVHS